MKIRLVVTQDAPKNTCSRREAMSHASHSPLLVLVAGLPGTGKTALSRRLATDLAVPLVAKDEIKELLFETLGWKDRDWSVRLGGASFELLYLFIEKALAAKASIVVDADFSSPERATERLSELVAKYSCRIVQVQLICDGNVLLERFQRRSHDGTRHPGHVDHTNIEAFRPSLLKGRRDALELIGSVIEVDTTVFDTVPYNAVLGRIRDEVQ